MYEVAWQRIQKLDPTATIKMGNYGEFYVDSAIDPILEDGSRGSFDRSTYPTADMAIYEFTFELSNAKGLITGNGASQRQLEWKW